MSRDFSKVMTSSISSIMMEHILSPISFMDAILSSNLVQFSYILLDMAEVPAAKLSQVLY